MFISYHHTDGYGCFILCDQYISTLQSLSDLISIRNISKTYDVRLSVTRGYRTQRCSFILKSHFVKGDIQLTKPYKYLANFRRSKLYWSLTAVSLLKLPVVRSPMQQVVQLVLLTRTVPLRPKHGLWLQKSVFLKSEKHSKYRTSQIILGIAHKARRWQTSRKAIKILNTFSTLSPVSLHITTVIGT